MLKVYIGSTTREVIKYNDAWFDSHIYDISISDTVKNIIKTIDKVDYLDNYSISARYEDNVALGIKELSNGCKTAINVVTFKNKIFNAVGCGDNALNVIFNFKHGNILLPTFIMPRQFSEGHFEKCS